MLWSLLLPLIPDIRGNYFSPGDKKLPMGFRSHTEEKGTVCTMLFSALSALAELFNYHLCLHDFFLDCLQLECQSHGNGAHLASVLNTKEANTIAEYISGYQKNKPVWIGLHDPQKVTSHSYHKCPIECWNDSTFALNTAILVQSLVPQMVLWSCQKQSWWMLGMASNFKMSKRKK